jgi:hypothetical protein
MGGVTSSLILWRSRWGPPHTTGAAQSPGPGEDQHLRCRVVTSPKPATAAAPPEDGPGEVLQAARILWPAPLEVAYARGRSHPGSVCEQILLPGPAARISVPADTRRGAARAIMRFSSALPRRQVATRLASALTVAVGPRSLVPHRLVVTGTSADSLRDHLSAALGQPVSFGFGIGTARANRKPVLALFGKDGRRLGFAKIGVDPFTDDQVTREHHSLTEVQRARIGGVRTPTLLDFGTWDDHPVLVISALQPSAWETARRGARTPPATQMEALGTAFGVQEATLAQSPWWSGLVALAEGLPPGRARSDLLEDMETVVTRWADQEVRLGAWHGDWTPWNMGWSHGELLLWDFERFELGAPLGLDACHFALSIPSRTTDPAEIIRRLGQADPGEDRALAALVKATYLVAITCRYQAAAHSENGRLIAPRAALMAGCLTEWLRRTADQGARG